MEESFKQRAAVIFLLRREGKVLLELRNRNSHWMAGYWGIPGGRLEPAETMREAAVREVKEELGIETSLNDVILTHVMHAGPRNDPWIFFFVELRTFQGEPHIAEEDHAENLGWFTLDSLPSPMVHHGAYALLAIERGERYSEFYW